ncbi:T9SS type A sorting domain-containing protein [Fibrobacterota bacterium]
MSKSCKCFFSCLLLSLFCLCISPAWAIIYEVGPGKALAEIHDFPWEDVTAGDTILIYYREEPYRSKWSINNSGTEEHPIAVIGVLGPDGVRPVVDGREAVARPTNPYIDYEDRQIIKVENDASYLIFANLDLTSTRPGNYYFTITGERDEYRTNASSMFVQSGSHMLFHNMIFRDCGNGFFSARWTVDLVIQHCQFYENGIIGSIYEHNNYTSTNGILFQYNRFGALCDNCSGNSLKDRSAGTVIRYNWIESTNRMLDLVESGSQNANPGYYETHVYGNIVIDDGSGNNFMVHYGGDNGNEPSYRKGTLYFYNNTCITTRTGTEMIIRGSTDDEHVEFVNNIVYASRGTPRILGNAGTMNAYNNWFVSGYDPGVSGFNDAGNNITGSDPGFEDFENQDFRLTENSPAVNAGVDVTGLDGFHPIEGEYVSHQLGQVKRWIDAPDMGALEYGTGEPVKTTWAYIQGLRFEQKVTNSNNIININYTLPRGGAVNLDVYNSMGRHVKSLASGSLPAGNHTAIWNARGFPAGTYFSTLKTGQEQITKPAIIAK